MTESNRDHPTCGVCGQPFPEALYESGSDVSITSLGEISAAPLCVYFCEQCAHVQTREIDNLAAYYDTGYNILIDSEEEDQIYQVANGKKIFRIEHQVETFFRKIPVPGGANILDYGCAKGSSLKRIYGKRADIRPYFFDVSEVYVPFWEKITTSEHWASYAPNSAWASTMDIVTSFFSLEHVSNPNETLHAIHTLLKPGGLFYAVLPNLMVNVADFVVVDHVHHYTDPSLRYLLSRQGFELLELDADAHDGAWVLTARKIEEKRSPHQIPSEDKNRVKREIEAIGRYWSHLDARIRGFEKTQPEGSISAIYGGGFWGAYIASRLRDRSKLRCFLDQNPFLQGKCRFNIPVLSPAEIPDAVQSLYVGLNPKTARQILSEIPALRERTLLTFFP